jgi:hypothetical protein
VSLPGITLTATIDIKLFERRNIVKHNKSEYVTLTIRKKILNLTIVIKCTLISF